MRAIWAAYSTFRTASTHCRARTATRAPSWTAITTTSGPRAGFAWQANSKLVLRGGYGLFFGERDQNQQVTQFSGNLPNVPVGLASEHVRPLRPSRRPYTINTPIKSRAHRPFARLFHGGESLCRHHSHGRLSRFARPHAAPVQLRHSVSVDRHRFCSKPPTAARSAAISRRCSSMRIRSPSRRRSREQQAGKPALPVHQRHSDSHVFHRFQRLQLG